MPRLGLGLAGKTEFIAPALNLAHAQSNAHKASLLMLLSAALFAGMRLRFA